VLTTQTRRRIATAAAASIPQRTANQSGGRSCTPRSTSILTMTDRDGSRWSRLVHSTDFPLFTPHLFPQECDLIEPDSEI